MTRPAHHQPDGRFRNPWPMAAGDETLRREVGRMARQWLFGKHPPDPPPGALPSIVPEMAGMGDVPRLQDGEVRLTWVGHATALLQLPGLNILTDPVWSDRCSPVSFMGPHRFVAPSVALDALPTIHAVLLSHDHYDHLDRPTVRALHRRFGDDLVWYTPLGYRVWLAGLGITRVVERDWWEGATLPGSGYEAVAVPARHWTRRRPLGTNSRLWCGWVVRPVASGQGRPHEPRRGGPGLPRRRRSRRVRGHPLGHLAPHVRGSHGASRAHAGGGTAAGLPAEDLRLLRHGETLARP